MQYGNDRIRDFFFHEILPLSQELHLVYSAYVMLHSLLANIRRVTPHVIIYLTVRNVGRGNIYVKKFHRLGTHIQRAFRCRGAQSLRYRKHVYMVRTRLHEESQMFVLNRVRGRSNKAEWVYGLDTLYYGSYYTFVTTDNDGRVCALSLSFGLLFSTEPEIASWSAGDAPCTGSKINEFSAERM